jgi:glycosyltransferase involved in cell wall biosynthesis
LPPLPLHILHAVGSLRHTWGGLSKYVADLATEQARQGCRVSLITADESVQECWPVENVERETLRNAVSTGLFRQVDIVHVHGLWLPFCHRVLRQGLKNHKPTILGTHGMLEPAALKFSSWKKRIASFLYQNADLKNASAIHVTGTSELETIRRRGLVGPVIISSPGIELRPLPDWTQREESRIALFVGRIHPVKGIDMLVAAWKAINPTNWKLLLCGPDGGNYVPALLDQIHGTTIEYIGPVFDAKKEELYRNASLVLQPSLSENFSLTIVEALASSIPVLTTTTTPWKSIAERRCGWCVEPNPSAIKVALQNALSESVESRMNMGGIARAFTQECFSWPSIVYQLDSCYRWFQNRGNVPEGVVL